MTESWTVAEAVAGFLAARGVKRCYGLPGGEVNDLISSVEAAGIKFLLTHHETSAAYMADAEAQLAGRPGVCIATVGPGATNLVNGIANAFLDRTPLLALVGDYEAEVRDAWTHMNLDLVRLYRPVSKLAERITSANVYSLLPRAWDAAMTGAKGPACLMLAAADAVMQVERRAWQPVRATRATRRERSAASKLEPQVRAAKTPVLMLGLGARSAGVADAAAAFAHQWRIPVVLTPKAKGWYPADGGLFAGVYAGYGSGGVEQVLSESDLILGVGLDGCEFIRPWRFGRVTSLSANGVVDTAYPCQPVACSPELTLLQLAEADGPEKDGARQAAAARTAAERALRGQQPRRIPGPAAAGQGLDPAAAVAAVRRAAPRHAVVTCDVGMLKLFLCQYWPAYQPNTFLLSNGLSSMGYGLPAATAAALLLDAVPVLALLGDGGLLMCAGELETLARTGASVVVVVAVDASMALIRLKAEEAGLGARHNDFGAPDYAALARSMGLNGLRAESPADLEAKVAQCLHGHGASLVEFGIDFDAYRMMV